MNKNVFQKNMRLLCKTDFDFVFNKPKLTKQNGILLLSRINHLKFPRLGLSISKKYIKCAHERNKIKRYARETFRIYQHNLSIADFILTIHSQRILDFHNRQLLDIFKKLWHRHLNY